MLVFQGPRRCKLAIGETWPLQRKAQHQLPPCRASKSRFHCGMLDRRFCSANRAWSDERIGNQVRVERNTPCRFRSATCTRDHYAAYVPSVGRVTHLFFVPLALGFVRFKLTCFLLGTFAALFLLMGSSTETITCESV